jgi:hypothetical protein
MNVSLSILQAGIDNKVQISTVDINSRFKILTSTDNYFKIQRKIGTTLYDSLDLIFNDTDKTSILKINNIDILASLALNASASNVYTKEEINNNDVIFGNALNNKADKSNTYLKSEINTSLNAKLNDVISGSSLSFKNSSAADVLVLWNNASKDIEAKGKFYVSNDLSVIGSSTFSNTMTVNALSGAGGTVRVISNNDGNESSFGCYNYINLRASSPGDMWVFGSNCWNAPTNAFSIGTPGKKSCFRIGVDGVVTLDYKLRTPELLVNTIRGNGEPRITIDDNVTITEKLIVNGTITDNTRSLNPFWICGKVAANGTVLSSNRGNMDLHVIKQEMIIMLFHQLMLIFQILII